MIFAVYRQLLYFQFCLLKDCSHSYEEADNGEDRRPAVLAADTPAVASIVTAMSLDAAVGFVSSHSVDFDLYTGFLGLIVVASVGNVPEP